MPKLGKPQPYHLPPQNYSVSNYGTQKRGQGYLTTTELTKIIIPLSGCHAQIGDYVNFVLWYRSGEITVVDCLIAAKALMISALPRISSVPRNYGYLEKADGVARDAEQYHINALIESEIAEILATPITDASLQMILDQIRQAKLLRKWNANEFRISGSVAPTKPNSVTMFLQLASGALLRMSPCRRCWRLHISSHSNTMAKIPSQTGLQ